MLINNINPTLFDCSNLKNDVVIGTDDEISYPPVIRLTIEEAESTKMCLLDDGFSLFLYIIDQDYIE